MRRKIPLSLRMVVFWVCLFKIGTAEANLQSNKLFKETYPGKPPTYYTCALCHTGKIGKGGDLNPYGQSLGRKPSAPLTVEQLKAAEVLDPDKDGVSSGEEIQKGTHPGVADNK